MQEVLSAVIRFVGKLSTAGAFTRPQHVPPKKPNAPGIGFFTAAMVCRTELPSGDVGSLACSEIIVGELHLSVQMEHGKVDTSKQARLSQACYFS